MQQEIKACCYSCSDWRMDRTACTSCFSCNTRVYMQGAQISGMPHTSIMFLMQYIGMQGAQLSGVPHTSIMFLMQYIGMQGAQLSGVPHTSIMFLMQYIGMQGAQLSGMPHTSIMFLMQYIGMQAQLSGVPHTSIKLLMQYMGVQGAQLSGVTRLQGVCQLRHGCRTGQAVILLVNQKVKTIKWPLFHVFSIHSVVEPMVLQQFARGDTWCNG